jgi:hypothetical protein
MNDDDPFLLTSLNVSSKMYCPSLLDDMRKFSSILHLFWGGGGQEGGMTKYTQALKCSICIPMSLSPVNHSGWGIP